MIKTKKGVRLAAGIAALALVAAACGSDSAAPVTTDTEAPIPEVSYPTSLADCANVTYDYTTPESTSNGMTVTYDIAPEAVWEDGSPITVADFAATWSASLNTPGSITTTGYDQITAVDAGTSDKQVVATFKSVYAPYKTLFFPLLKAAALSNTSDVSADFADFLGYSARPYKMKSWSPSQVVYVPNDKYWGTDKALTAKVVMVPKADSDTEIASIKAGEVDFIYPQYYGGITEAVAQDDITSKVTFGGDYEALYFNQKCGPFADPIFRAAFSMSIDREALYEQIYIPINDQGVLLQCGPIVPGPYCAGDEFAGSYDTTGAETLLTDNGWAKGSDGYWAKGGESAPAIRWIINTGNTRRENTQA
ncbi:MAG: ABC transporter substrate-binding protein, partial [Ilumatobacteraceae bacterium]